ncbi:alpha/beta-hydrolase [Schizopora paradoxa]|uniref:Alpha/beta-hydrolase n=1 Tax=Schizopora paradoxa TaxID=27342 RepID=A0A0H2RUW5_9AGAM|nr:alpha/beta-hydrolase [Schizopora paradoxa]
MKKEIKSVHSSDGLQIYADSNGNVGKAAIVFIHGFRLSGACFDRVFEDEVFSSKFHLVRYDLRGQGRSGQPENAEGHVSKLYADDFAAVCDAFGVKKPYTVGWSYGCTVLADLATYLPYDYLSGSIFLCGPPWLVLKHPEIVVTTLLPVIPHLVSEATPADEANAACWAFTNMLFSQPETVPVETKWLWRGMMGSAPTKSYRMALERESSTEKLYAMGKRGYPLRYIIGLEEQVFDGRVLVELVRKEFTNFSVLEIEGGGHSVFHQNTREVVDSITEFVNNNKWTG